MNAMVRGTGRWAARSTKGFGAFIPSFAAAISPEGRLSLDAAPAPAQAARGADAPGSAQPAASRSSRLVARQTPRRVARQVAAMGFAAAVAAGFGSFVIAQPAHAAPAEADIETKVADGNIQGKAGAKASIGYQITNHGKIDVGVIVTIQVPSNSEIESAGGCTVGGNRRAASCQVPALKAGASVNGSVQVVLRTAGEGDGGIAARINPTQRVNDPKPGNDTARFKIRITGASASPSPSPSKSTRASRSASADPTGSVSDEVIAPPEAGNGAIPREDDPKTPVSKDSGGLSFGFWIGVVAIVAALGLVGSLFYFRRRDRLEPDTGVFHLPATGHDSATSVITPGVYGSPAASTAHAGTGFQNGSGYGQGSQHGQGFQHGQGAPGGSNVYGAPSPSAGLPVSAPPSAVPSPAVPARAFPPPAFPAPAFPPPVSSSQAFPASAFPPPAFPPPAFPPPAGASQGDPPPAPAPGANDQTVIMRKPDDL